VVFSPADYARLLGLYLRTGQICELGGTQRLELFVDPGVAAETAALLRRCFPDNRVGRSARRGGTTVVASVHHSHLRCLFPAHGREPWQDELVASAR
jgi:hypothetical protein